ncbi:STM3941 family protein [Portibacter marinus]|uniref:STM3941 family protein n=1 Tax=Portibacter marinus TaxID=2898660 RepID=UPI001F1D0B19|nr:STM3941 family protein [Portibacter marinus]
MSSTIEIPLNRNKLFVLLGAAVLFILLGVWLIWYASFPVTDGESLFTDPLILRTLGIICIIFFAGAGILGFNKIRDRRTGLVINNQGIIDHSNASSIGLIRWKEISDIEATKVMSTKFLLVKLKNPDEYISRAETNMKRKLMSVNHRTYGTPVTITSDRLKYDSNALEQLIKSEFDKHKS